MNIYRIIVIVLVFISFAIPNLYATEPRPYSVGLGEYTLWGIKRYKGLQAVGTYAFNNNLEIRGRGFSATDKRKEVDINGADFSGVFGGHLLKNGPKVFVGLGIYYHESKSRSLDFNETAIDWFPFVGAGYNFGRVAMDFDLTLRNPQKYPNEINSQDGTEYPSILAVVIYSYSIRYRF